MLTGPFPTLPTIVGFLKSFLQQKQTMENALFPVLAARALATATVYTLVPLPGVASAVVTGVPTFNSVFDVIGRIIGQPRQGLNDHDYRSILYLKVAVNRSGARVTDWSGIAAILLQTAGGGVEYVEGTAEFYLFVGDMELNPNIVAQVIAGAVGNGIGASFGYTVWPDGNDFEFDDVNNASTTGQGTFGDTAGSGDGGLLISVALVS